MDRHRPDRHADGRRILLHSIPLDAPDGVDSLELLCVANRDQAAVKPTSRWFLRFTRAAVTESYPLNKLPRNPAAAIKSLLPVFRQKVSAAVLQRLGAPRIIDRRTHKIEIRSRRVRKP